jgi:hypothetical protein
MCGGNVYGDGWRILTKVLAGWERGYSRAVQRVVAQLCSAATGRKNTSSAR